jgi:hypothetical protein
MKRAVYIGGFANGATSAEGVAKALTYYYDDVDPFTFSSAMDRPDVIRRAVHGVDVFTHSAGMLAVVGFLPGRIEAFGAPLPRSKLGLVGRTVAKTARMHTPGVGIRSVEDIPAVTAYNLSATAELATHLKGNLGRLGQIARFSAVNIAIAAERSGIPTALTYTNGDEYFSLTAQGEAAATAIGIDVTRIPGIHDELVIRPAATLQRASIEQRL